MNVFTDTRREWDDSEIFFFYFSPAFVVSSPQTSQFPAASFGGLGHVLAHEESHAFDAEGAPADPDGLYRHWYSPPTKSHLEDRKQCLRAVYDVPSGGSWPTESEDYADSQGLMVRSLRACAGDAGHRTTGAVIRSVVTGRTMPTVQEPSRILVDIIGMTAGVCRNNQAVGCQSVQIDREH
ncbi:hypothetical protein HPB48_019350 [Haemaphysalis longicornis]|uniref:Peptidase M13 C-terminal domain-containing protein n=1 Tax=Haemaphysalis longicornis TaxID=44386 RepID=A0A9J6G5I5_HAELO|nr:hypothetical protein HPB48_019350 [Haemaphysalis longicornis]